MNLEMKKKQMELKRVLMAKDEFELRIEEHKEEISRIEAQMKIQDVAAEKLNKELETLKSK